MSRIFYGFLAILLIAQNAKSEEILMPGELWETGYVTVRGEGNELFYFLVKSRDNNPQAPLVIWLNGGPGCASSYGLFTENGPHVVDREKLKFIRNEFSWNNFADLLYVDQPVEVGFSLVKNDENLCINQTCVANDFYKFLLGFIEKYPQYQKRPLFITGESYGGHYVPSIAGHLARARNPLINLQGIAVGNPFTSQNVQLGPYAAFLKENGNFTSYQYLKGKLVSWLCQVSHKVGLKPELLTQICDFGLGGAVTLKNVYDIRDERGYDDMEKKLVEKLAEKEVLDLLKPKKTNMALCNDTIYNIFAADLAYSVAPEIEYLLDSQIDVMLYFGDKDYICNWRGGEALVNSLKWAGQSQFLNTKPLEWSPENINSGKYRKYLNLNFMVVYGAGHMVPMDQSKAGLAMIKTFIEKKFK